MTELTHFDADGAARMVDVGAKPDTERVAVASGQIEMLPTTFGLIAKGEHKIKKAMFLVWRALRALWLLNALPT